MKNPTRPSPRQRTSRTIASFTDYRRALDAVASIDRPDIEVVATGFSRRVVRPHRSLGERFGRMYPAASAGAVVGVVGVQWAQRGVSSLHLAELVLIVVAAAVAGTTFGSIAGALRDRDLIRPAVRVVPGRYEIQVAGPDATLLEHQLATHWRTELDGPDQTPAGRRVVDQR